MVYDPAAGDVREMNELTKVAARRMKRFFTTSSET
jgi:hypothetical protein